MLDERIVEQHRKLAQIDREIIMGVGFSIQMRPQKKPAPIEE
jgi:hypothetical protein